MGKQGERLGANSPPVPLSPSSPSSPSSPPLPTSSQINLPLASEFIGFQA
ncbi:hypothetical protein H1Q63_01145 [Desmonostoc muscorum CCALA 125]|nr:hypothetical protein [Desmonostoc muscorum CCALA 125]